MLLTQIHGGQTGERKRHDEKENDKQADGPPAFSPTLLVCLEWIHFKTSREYQSCIHYTMEVKWLKEAQI